MSYTLEYKSPADYSERSEREKRCYDLLNSLGIDYWRCDHPDANANTMADCLEIDAILEATVCKNLFLTNRQKTEHYLLMMPGDKVFKTKELPPQVGCARLSFGSPEEMEAYIGCAPGSASILGLMNDPENKVVLLVDEDVLKGEFVGCHPCLNTTSLKIRTEDMFGPLLKAMGHEMKTVRLIGE